MRRSISWCLAVSLVLGLSLMPAAAKGRCRAVSDGAVACGGGLALSRVCHREGKRCNREGGSCETLVVELECQADGILQVGMGCFCGGGSVGVIRDNPVSFSEYLELLEAIDDYRSENETCELPPGLIETE